MYAGGFEKVDDGVYLPLSSAADAVISLNVDPGGFRSPATARFTSGFTVLALSAS